MKKSEILELKVGDKVKIVAGSKSYKDYVQEMASAVGQVCTVNEFPRNDSSDVYVTLEARIGGYEGLYFPPSWLEKVEEAETNPVSIKKKEHPKAEVLRWIADCKVVEYRSPGGTTFGILDTSANFSIFESAEYRICTNPEKYKKYQVLCRMYTNEYYIAHGKHTKEEASKLQDFVKVLE